MWGKGFRREDGMKEMERGERERRFDKKRKKKKRGRTKYNSSTYLISWILDPFLPITQPMSCRAVGCNSFAINSTVMK